MSRSGAGNPVVTLHAPGTVKLSEAIPITIRIENKSAEPLELYLRGREPTCDIVVTGTDGNVVWRRLEGEVVPAIIRLEVIPPGQALEFRHSWDQRNNAGNLVAPDSYSMRGSVLTDGSLALSSTAVRLHIDRS